MKRAVLISWPSFFAAMQQRIAAAIRCCIAAKKEGHEINTARFIQPDRPMYSIGG